MRRLLLVSGLVVLAQVESTRAKEASVDPMSKPLPEEGATDDEIFADADLPPIDDNPWSGTPANYLPGAPECFPAATAEESGLYDVPFDEDLNFYDDDFYFEGTLPGVPLKADRRLLNTPTALASISCHCR
jgi:hypothetical protein